MGKVLRFSGDVWKNHACCVTLLAERDTAAKPEWAQRVNNAIGKAQLWTRGNQGDTDYAGYEAAGIVRNKGWYQRRIDFQPYPFPIYTEALVAQLKQTKVEGDAAFLQALDPAFVARDLVDDRFVKKALAAVGGPQAFGLPADLLRREVITG